MRVKVTKVEDSLHPDQIIVSIATKDGSEFLPINRHSLARDSSIEIGHPVGKKGSFSLVELPFETDSGAWRVWVDENSISDPTFEAAE